ncbi:hypothetical protein AT15_02145 [Kosmotoga arenicorallina S304]|uniref:Uncharacterized protein n=1 Tax=Kosmotoga arenicorallina S304 TaxID=1453497 RepID=A0A176JZ75_9BACT|nr:HD-GYP domain-containing protein [Kosmotoga arenicorallina]OAA29341.1 hypothetical protein AT15_02145 [Kosmotoga arenicorallina S304]
MMILDYFKEKFLEVDLNPLKLKFHDEKTEKAFQEYYAHNYAQTLKYLLIAAVTLYLAFLFVDLYIVPMVFKELLAIRIIFVVFCIFLVSLKNTKLFYKYTQAIVSGIILAASAGLMSIIVIADNIQEFRLLGTYQYDASIIEVLIFLFALARLGFWWSVFTGWAIVLMYNIGILFAGSLPGYILIDRNVVFSGIIFIGMIASYLFEYESRKAFYFQQKVAFQRDKLDELNKNLERKVLEQTRELRKSNEELRESFNRLLLVLAEITNLRDPLTTTHHEETAKIAVFLGEKLGFKGESLENLRIASLLHDIGKIGVPAALLLKSTRLSEIEYEIVKQHVEIGVELLKNKGFSEKVLTIILQHHERLNGTGYPKGLRNDEILLESRILAVANVFTAMCSHRPYRPAHTPEEALLELKENAGAYYDPEVVSVFEDNFEEIVRLLNS